MTRFCPSLCLMAALSLSATAFAVPAALTNQGRLLDAAGAPLDGSHDLAFALYDTPSGGSPLWSETQSLDFDGGFYSAELGSSTAIDPAALQGDTTLYLGIGVDGGAELPSRVALTSVPFALHAGSASSASSVDGGVVNATEIKVNGTTVIDSSGAVQATVDWSRIQNAPVASDTLAELSCDLGQAARWDGSGWACADDAAVDFADITGILGITQIPVGTDSDKVAAGNHDHDGAYAAKGDVYSKAEVDSLTAPITGTGTTLGSRVASASARGIGRFWEVQWEFVPSMSMPFTATGGPVQITSSFPLNGGSTSICRPLIDGEPAGLYTGTDTTYLWQEGLAYAAEGWVMWNSSRMYEGLTPGAHRLSFQCRSDSASTTSIGNGSMTETLSVIPYDKPGGAEVKAYSMARQGGQSIGASSFASITGMSQTFEAQGGPVMISISIPMSGGSHSSCRPLIDGSPAGKYEIDDITYGWQEGLTYTVDGWAMWNRTRIYENIPTGNHNVTVECRTDSGSVSIGNGRMSMHLGVVSYKKASDSGTKIKAYRAVQKQQHSIGAGSWQALSGLGTSITTSGGPVQIGVSLPMTNGSHSTCRPTLDGAAITTGEPDDFSYIWHDGLIQTNDGWGLWDRVRVYKNISAGTYTLGVQCRTDGGTLAAGHNQMVSTVWAVAYDK